MSQLPSVSSDAENRVRRHLVSFLVISLALARHTPCLRTRRTNKKTMIIMMRYTVFRVR